MDKPARTHNDAIEVSAKNFGGTLNYELASKSELHRFLICAALSEYTTRIICKTQAKDVFATVQCLNALGAKIKQSSDGFAVTPIDRTKLIDYAELNVGESGSTFRFLLPVVCALGINCTFNLSKRLSERPIQPLIDELKNHGANIYWDKEDKTKLHCTGKISGGTFNLESTESSQFISGILLALPLLGKSCLKIYSKTESKPYINMTVVAMRCFGINITTSENEFIVAGKYGMFDDYEVSTELDWSNRAFWLCAGAISKNGLNLLCPNDAIVCKIGNDNRLIINKSANSITSLQGDEKIIWILKQFGAEINLHTKDKYCKITVQKPQGGSLRAIDLDAADIPDLVPAIALVACAAEGTTHIHNVGRLRLKESDRLEAICEALDKLGAKLDIENDDELVIYGKAKMHGACIDSYNDHRIAMMAACASILCDEPVTIINASAVSKSYPSFFDDFAILGGKVKGA